MTCFLVFVFLWVGGWGGWVSVGFLGGFWLFSFLRSSFSLGFFWGRFSSFFCLVGGGGGVGGWCCGGGFFRFVLVSFSLLGFFFFGFLLGGEGGGGGVWGVFGWCVGCFFLGSFFWWVFFFFGGLEEGCGGVWGGGFGFLRPSPPPVVQGRLSGDPRTVRRFLRATSFDTALPSAFVAGEQEAHSCSSRFLGAGLPENIPSWCSSEPLFVLCFSDPSHSLCAISTECRPVVLFGVALGHGGARSFISSVDIWMCRRGCFFSYLLFDQLFDLPTRRVPPWAHVSSRSVDPRVDVSSDSRP